MQKKWKRTGAALLIAGLTVTGTSYAWADEKALDSLDLRQLGKDTPTDVVEDSTETVELPKEESVVKEAETNKVVKEDKATTTRKEPNPNATLRYSRAIYHHRFDMTIIKQNSRDHSSFYLIDEWSLFSFFNEFAQ